MEIDYPHTHRKVVVFLDQGPTAFSAQLIMQMHLILIHQIRMDQQHQQLVEILEEDSKFNQ